jgi:hypothetical protein
MGLIYRATKIRKPFPAGTEAKSVKRLAICVSVPSDQKKWPDIGAGGGLDIIYNYREKIKRFYIVDISSYDHMVNTFSLLLKNDNNTYKVLNDENAQVFSSTLLSETIEYTTQALKDKNGQLYFKKGIYEADNPSWGGPVLHIGTDAFPNNKLTLKGERGAKITLKDSEWPEYVDRNFATFKCNTVIDGIEFDFKNKIRHGLFTDYTVNFEVRNCSFQNASRFLVGTGPNVLSTLVENNWFGSSGTAGDSETGIGNDDQIAVSSIEETRVLNNIFDRTRTNGNGYGSSITCGSTKRYKISGNIVKRKPIDIHHGISAEGDLGIFEEIDISNNHIINGTIAIAKTDPGYSNIEYKSIKIKNNTLEGGLIKVHGSNVQNWQNQKIDNVDINGNTVLNSQEYGIYLLRVSGTAKISDNIVKNSNILNFNGTNWERIAPLSLEYTKDVKVNDNIFIIENKNNNPCCVALYYNNSFVTFDNNVLENFKPNTPFIKVWGNDNWIAGSDNKLRNPHNNVLVGYKNGSTGNTVDITGTKTKLS